MAAVQRLAPVRVGGSGRDAGIAARGNGSGGKSLRNSARRAPLRSAEILTPSQLDRPARPSSLEARSTGARTAAADILSNPVRIATRPASHHGAGGFHPAAFCRRDPGKPFRVSRRRGIVIHATRILLALALLSCDSGAGHVERTLATLPAVAHADVQISDSDLAVELALERGGRLRLSIPPQNDSWAPDSPTLICLERLGPWYIHNLSCFTNGSGSFSAGGPCLKSADAYLGLRATSLQHMIAEYEEFEAVLSSWPHSPQSAVEAQRPAETDGRFFSVYWSSTDPIVREQDASGWCVR